MAGQIETPNGDEMGQAAADPWAAAFAALEQEGKEGPEEAPDTGGGDGNGDDPDAEGADADPGTPGLEPADGAEDEDMPGGPGDLPGDGGVQGGAGGLDDLGVSDEEVAQYRERFVEDIRERTITDVAQAYIRQGARHHNGRLGATIGDKDICRRDEDGVPHFYNPETGREFTGDNPRLQAQQWVDAYNKELADNFNQTCAEYSQQLMDREGGRLAIIEFAPKYRALDDVRRSMLDSILEDYEVLDDSGEVVSYSIDLDKALAAVNRQVQVIQSRFAGQAKAAPKAKPAPTGPALDMPSSSGHADDGVPEFRSLADALEWKQNQMLAKQKGRK